jgi:hypothetical protein
VYNIAVFEIKKEIPIKSAWFDRAEVELPFNAGTGRKLHCQKRGESKTLSFPARLDLASPGAIPTSASAAERPQRRSG